MSLSRDYDRLISQHYETIPGTESFGGFFKYFFTGNYAEWKVILYQYFLDKNKIKLSKGSIINRLELEVIDTNHERSATFRRWKDGGRYFGSLPGMNFGPKYVLAQNPNVLNMPVYDATFNLEGSVDYQIVKQSDGGYIKLLKDCVPSETKQLRLKDADCFKNRTIIDFRQYDKKEMQKFIDSLRKGIHDILVEEVGSDIVDGPDSIFDCSGGDTYSDSSFVSLEGVFDPSDDGCQLLEIEDYDEYEDQFDIEKLYQKCLEYCKAMLKDFRKKYHLPDDVLVTANPFWGGNYYIILQWHESDDVN